MAVSVQCPNPTCAKVSTGPESVVGRSVRCKHCGQSFVAQPTVDGRAADTRPTLKATSEALPAVSAVGRFQVRARLGAGAFGTVYRAYDPQLDREVALKVPNAAVLDNPRRIERFLREAKAAANLRHPHIVPVFDAGKDADRYFIASAFISGQKLADAIPDGGIELDRAARLARELAEALAYAHEQGVVHRDVKPDNVMLDAGDRVHLMDFGLAARQDDESRLTNDGAVLGTPSYMAPEQARGQQGEARPAADQYSAGVVLYELLTGRVPFEGPPTVVLHNQIHIEPDRPSKSRPDVPRDLETICLKSMAKRPEDRYADCQALADDLRRWQEGEPITARRLSARERLARWAKKNKTVAGLVSVIAMVLVAGVVVSISFAALAARQALRAEDQKKLAQDAATDAEAKKKVAEDAQAETERQRQRAQTNAAEAQENFQRSENERRRADAARKAAEDEKKRADESLLRAQAAEKSANRNLYNARMQLAQNAWKENRLDLIHTLLNEAEKVDPDNQLRSFEWGYWDSLINRQSQRLDLPIVVDPPGQFEPCASPDGRWLCVLGRRKDDKLNRRDELWLVEANTGQVGVKLEPPKASLSRLQLAFHPQGTMLFGGSGPLLMAWSIPEGRLLWEVEDKDLVLQGKVADRRGILTLAVSPDGARLYAGAGRLAYGYVSRMEPRAIHIWSTKEGSSLGPVPIAPVGDKLHQLWVAQEGKVDVLYGAEIHSYDGSFFRYDVKTGAQENLALPYTLNPLPKNPPKNLPKVDPKAPARPRRVFMPSVRRTVFFAQDSEQITGERQFDIVQPGTWRILHQGKLPPELAKTSFSHFDFDLVTNLAVVGDEFRKELLLWDVRTNKVTRRLLGHSEVWYVAVLGPKAQRILSCGANEARSWDLQAEAGTAKEYRILNSPQYKDLGEIVNLHALVNGDETIFRQVLQSKDGALTLKVDVLNWRTGKPGDVARHLFPVPKNPNARFDSGLYLPAYSSDGQWAACKVKTDIVVRDLKTGQDQTIPAPPSTVGLYLSPHGRWLLIGCRRATAQEGNNTTYLHLWDRTKKAFVPLGDLLGNLKVTPESMNGTWHRYAIEPGERLLYSMANFTHNNPIVDLNERRIVATYSHSSRPEEDFTRGRPIIHPSGKYFAATNNTALGYVSLETGKVLKQKSGQDRAGFARGSGDFYPIRPLAFSPDGRRLAVISSNRIVNILDAETLDEILLLKTPVDLNDIQFSADGRHLIGLSETNRLRHPDGKGIQAVVWGP